MSFTQIIFYLFSTVLIFAATMVITSRNPVRAAMSLVLTFFACAGLWVLLEAEFLAITLILVYVGAVMVLFLFVVMMLDINVAILREGFARFLPIGIVVAVMMLSMMVMVVGPEHFGLEHFAAPAGHEAGYSNTRELGLLLYTVYLFPFELAAMILLVAIVAAIVLTLRRRPDSKAQSVSAQVAVDPADRLKIIKMESEARR